jgi:hypothetical protein
MGLPDAGYPVDVKDPGPIDLETGSERLHLPGAPS